MEEKSALPIAGPLFYFSWRFVVEFTDRCAGLADNFQSKVLFEKKESGAPELGRSTVNLSARVRSRVILARRGCAYCRRVHCATCAHPFFFSNLTFAFFFRGPRWQTDCFTPRRTNRRRQVQNSIKPEDHATNGVLTLKSFFLQFCAIGQLTSHVEIELPIS
jgi:hypothetical protein